MLKIKSIFTLIAVVLAVPAVAQLTVIKTPVNPVVISSTGLTSFTVINTSSQKLTFMPHYSLKNQSGEAVYVSVGQRVSINANSSIVLDKNKTGLVNESFLGKNGNLLKTQNKLPADKYIACVTLKSDQIEAVFSDCYEVEVESIDNLFLVYPYDEDTIQTKYPVLNWRHLQPFSILKPSESFNIVVCERKKDQEKEQAIIENKPLFSRQNLQNHSVNYPPDAVSLERGKTYVWMVTKTYRSEVVAESETWEFTLDTIETPKITKYIVLENKATSSVYLLESNTIYFKFEEPYVGGNLTSKVMNDKGQIMNSNANKDEKSVSIKSNGYNRYQVNIDQLSLKEGIYKLIVENDKKEKYYLKFKVK